MVCAVKGKPQEFEVKTLTLEVLGGQWERGSSWVCVVFVKQSEHLSFMSLGEGDEP